MNNLTKLTLAKAVKAHEVGEIQKAETLYLSILKEEPDNPDANHNMGILFIESSRVEDALKYFERSVRIAPLNHQFWISLINAQIILGKNREARNSFKKAKKNGVSSGVLKELKKKMTTLSRSRTENSNAPKIGKLKALFQKGRYPEVIREATGYTASFPRSVDLLDLIAASNLALSRPAEAKKYYLKAAEIQPSPILYNQLGNTAAQLGDLDDALKNYMKAIELDPDLYISYKNAAMLLKGVSINRDVEGLEDLLIVLLRKRNIVRPTYLVMAVISLVKLQVSFSKILGELKEGKSKRTINQILKRLSKSKILLEVMSRCPLPDLEVEKLLVSVRKRVLLERDNLEMESDTIQFLNALALQCFTNEYIYNFDADEKKELAFVEKSIEQTLDAGGTPNEIVILCLACYKGLYNYPWSSSLIFPESLGGLRERHISQVAREARLKTEIPILRGLEDEVSKKVQYQYEQNPYPRWIDLSIPEHATTFTEYLETQNLKIPFASMLTAPSKDVLIAGCGTGQQVLELAFRYSDAKFLAIDLSLNSLGYAKRQTLDLGVGNIEYLQANILDIGKLEKRFHVIESVGVLHHMKEPELGWKILVDLLKPGGFMRIGLYSRLARRNIDKLRHEISIKKIDPTEHNLRDFRHRLIKKDLNDAHDGIKNLDSLFGSNAGTILPDFFSLSEFRDLLFHAQEQSFSLLSIERILDELGLIFCGFQLDHKVQAEFRDAYGSRDSIYDLKKWNEFENKNPDTFLGMYTFWCQKPL
ncbi:tetratricopeptide repeat protein [Gammaproteobacteria bacterium]|nr:tetratricopeptide repeat protein [Gammaproteobacteria bacterium]